MNYLLEEEINQLKENIYHTKTYILFQQAARQLEEYPELKKRVQAFRKDNYYFQIRGEGQSLEGLRNLWEDYEDILNHHVASQYITCEINLCRMIANIRDQLLEILDLEDVSFVE